MDIKDNGKSAIKGTLAAFAAYGMWGIFPLYWKQLESVEPSQIISHRILWAGLFCVLLLAARGRLPEIVNLIRNRKKLLVILACSAFLTVNWWVYIWAVNAGRVMESALGYYINPLFSIVLGMVFFREKADGWTKAAVIIASTAIIGAAVVYGSVPWISLSLAGSFSVYGALKKKLGLGPLQGLTIETLAAAPFALVFLLARQGAGTGMYWNGGAVTTILLTLAGVLTAIPLLLFAAAANSISLQKMGFIQYVSPTLQLFLGVAVFGEKPSAALLVAFIGVIIAVLLYVFTRRKALAGK
jgi:chloramphenicol-sensitive protein RarD